MKKIFLLSLMLGLCFSETTFASRTCRVTSCEKGGHTGYGYSLLRTDGSRGQEFSSGQCYRCNWGDNDHECKEGTIVAIRHRDYNYTNEIKGFFRCTDTGKADDDWLEYNPESSCDVNVVDVAEFARKMGRDYLVVSSSEHTTRHYLMGNAGAKTGAEKDNSGDNMVLSSGSDACVAYLCEDGYRANESRRKCEKDASAESETCLESDGKMHATEDIDLVTVCPDCNRITQGQCVNKDMFACYKAIKYRASDAKWNAVWNDVNACVCTPATQYEWNKDSGTCIKKEQIGYCDQLKQQGGASAQRLACCYAGNATTWNGSNDSTDVKNCVCIDPNKEWDGSACVAKINSFDNSECKYVANSYINCNNGRRIINHSEFTISAAELAGKSCKEFKAGKDMIAYIREKYCGVSGYTEEIPMDAKTKTAISNMEAFFKTSDDDVTVWRNEEGKFNTARLASDATAGVVLGTVGGVVSAKVIKKKQLEKGYDVLKCTVGGQKMADWGDVFNVGFRR